MPRRTGIGQRLAITGVGLSLFAAAPSAATDLAIADVVVTQVIDSPETPLIGDNVTLVRVLVDTPNTNDPIPNVDALIRVFIDGVEADYSPLRSTNGPITSPANPQPDEPDHHLNFIFIPPNSTTDLDLRVVLNPTLLVPWDDLTNNIVEINDLEFHCRGTVDFTYVPINYIPGGGPPSESMIEPGIGDGFLRGIYKPGRFDYHRSPLGQLLWTADVDDSYSELLQTLFDLQISQIPSEGYPLPDFMYGWLPGNPFFGVGAGWINGPVGFGNTQENRYQRTFAHEFGHNLGNYHNTDVVNTLCADVEHHLADPLGIPRFRTQALDIMQAGQYTDVAWVTNEIFLTAHDHPRFACDEDDPNDSAGGDPDTTSGSATMLRLAGVIDHEAGTVTLGPTMSFPESRPTPNAEEGILDIVLLDDRGRRIHEVRTAVDHDRTCCADPTHVRPTSPLYVLVPAEPRGRTVARIEVRDAADGRLMAAIDRTPSVPVVAAFGPASVDVGGEPAPFRPGMRIEDPIRVAWSVDDADGDEITAALFYSPDGEAWLPFRADITDGGFDLDPHQMPRSSHGRLRLIVSDGLNASIVESPMMSFLGSTQPEVYIITPNQFDSVVAGGHVVLHGYAWDHEQGTIADEIQWTSSLDGPIGTGRLLAVDDLSAGLHLLSATITDVDGNVSIAAKSITIEQRQLPPPDPDGSGSLGIGDLLALLAGFGACDDFCPGDLDLDGAVTITDLLILLAQWPV